MASLLALTGPPWQAMVSLPVVVVLIAAAAAPVAVVLIRGRRRMRQRPPPLADTAPEAPPAPGTLAESVAQTGAGAIAGPGAPATPALPGAPAAPTAAEPAPADTTAAEPVAAAQDPAQVIARLSHELTTPLNIVLGYLELLATGIPEPLPTPAQQQIARARTSGLHLQHVLHNLLTYARLRSGTERIHPVGYDVRAVVGEAARAAERSARDKGLDWRVVLPAAPIPAYGDPEKLAEILGQLLGNAVKFTERGYVAVTLDVQGDDVVLTVTDTGVGLRDEERARLFEAFWQSDESLTRAKEGAGLGLYIAGQFARLLGGRLDAHGSPGAGSTFTLSFPLRLPASEGAAEDPVREK